MTQRKLSSNPIPANLRAAAKHLREKTEPAPKHMVSNDESAAEFDAAAAGIDTALLGELSDRGFTHFPKIEGLNFPKVQGLYGGTARIYESSLATTEALWLRVEDVPTGDGSEPTSNATLHLSMPNALALAAQIIDLAHAAGWWFDPNAENDDHDR